MKLYDSLARTKKDFAPFKTGDVTLYVCGITPDNATHLGHAYTYVFFDTLIRFLTSKEYKVKYLQNATDINDSDDVIRQAKEVGSSWQEVAAHWINHFHTQMDALHVVRPTQYILASSVVAKIIDINKELIAKKFAYEKNGNVYFEIDKFKDYGKLSHYTKDQMLIISKERGNNPSDPNKKNPLDFVLWKQDEGEPNWESPWGKGRPGWHIECTAMIHENLGEQIDIHGGGHDLIFPHHESEIAQSEGYIGKKPYVKYWTHVGMVMYEGEKMSKSLGNLVLVEDLLKKYSPDAVRYLLLSHHYRDPWEYFECSMEEAEANLKQLLSKMTDNDQGDFKKFTTLLEDDMNTPEALWYLCESCGGPTLKKGLTLLGFVV